MREKELQDLLLELELFSESQIENFVQSAQNADIPLEDYLIEEGILEEGFLGKVLADAFRVKYVDLLHENIDPQIIDIIPDIVCSTHFILPFRSEENKLFLAMNDPSQLEIVALLEKKTGYDIQPFYTFKRQVREILSRHKDNLQEKLEELVRAQTQTTKKKASDDSSTVLFANMLIEYADRNRTSDIHIEPHDTRSLIRFRIDGMLHDILFLPLDIHLLLVSRIKILSKLRTDEHRAAQDGKFRFQSSGHRMDIRVSIVPTSKGEKIVLRLLSERLRQYNLEDIGLREADVKKVKRAISQPFGLLLAAGPTGSGKTTSLYAFLKLLNKREVNISTIEDPIEYEIEGINQIQVNAKTNLTFVSGLRSILRQDPNVIMVGEIRDPETAKIAVNAAMTGHLVLSTIHTNDAATTFPRLMDMGIEPFLVATSVNIVICQRLVRRICARCRVSVRIPPVRLKELFPDQKIPEALLERKELVLYQGKGCSICHMSGFEGRVGIFEVLEMSENIKSLAMKKASSPQIKQQALSEGMCSLFEDGLQKVFLGLTTLEELVRTIHE